MTRWGAAALSVLAALAAAALIGGRTGVIAGGFAVGLLALGLLAGRPRVVTTGLLILVAAFLAPLVVYRAAVDLRAPLLGALLLLALEAGHLSLEGERYDLPGGAAALLRRSVLLATVAVVGFGAAWVPLLVRAPSILPGVAGTAIGGVLVVSLLAGLSALRPSAPP